MVFEYAGLLSFLSRVLSFVFGWLSKGKSRLTPEQRVEHREQIRAEVASGFEWNPLSESYSYTEVIIRDINRVDEYPDVTGKKGISSWFRTGFLGTYHRGIELGLGYEGLVFDEKHSAWRLASYDEEPSTRVVRLGRLPYDEIVKINWAGDEHYPFPHIYCRFGQRKKEPWEAVVYAKAGKNPGGRPFYEDLAKYDDVTKLSSRLKTGYYRGRPNAEN